MTGTKSLKRRLFRFTWLSLTWSIVIRGLFGSSQVLVQVSMCTLSMCLSHEFLMLLLDTARSQHHALSRIDEGILALSCIEGGLATEAKLRRLHRCRVHIVIHRHYIIVPLVEAGGRGVVGIAGSCRDWLRRPPSRHLHHWWGTWHLVQSCQLRKDLIMRLWNHCWSPMAKGLRLLHRLYLLWLVMMISCKQALPLVRSLCKLLLMMHSHRKRLRGAATFMMRGLLPNAWGVVRGWRLDRLVSSLTDAVVADLSRWKLRHRAW